MEKIHLIFRFSPNPIARDSLKLVGAAEGGEKNLWMYSPVKSTRSDLS